MSVLIVTKNPDSGTGYFTAALCDVLDTDFKTHAIFFEEPSYRKKRLFSTYYYSPKTFPTSYEFSFSNIFRFFKTIYLLKQSIQYHKPDVLIAVDFHACLIAVFCKVLFFNKLKIIANTQTNIPQSLHAKTTGLLSMLLLRLIAYAYDLVDAHVCVSRGLAKGFYTTFKPKHRPIVIYNGIPLKKGRQKRLNKNRVFKLMTLGRLDEQKDMETLLNAVHLLSKKSSRFTAIIVGDGPQKELLRKRAKKLRVSQRVRFVGWKNNTSDYFRKSDVFILTSRWEGFGYVLIEAMKYGLPIISTDAPYGPREILDNGKAGVLVAVGDAEAIANAVIALQKDPRYYALLSGRSLRQFRNFSLDSTASQYRRLIVELAPNSPK